VLALVGVATCTASAGAVPRLEAGGGARVGSTGASVEYRQAKDDPAPTRIAFRVPAGYTFTPDANGAAVGSIVGTGIVQLATQPELLTPVLTMRQPAAFRSEGIACTGRDAHDAVWAMVVAHTGAPLDVPIFVDGRTFTICPDAALLGGKPTAIALQLGIVGGDANRPVVTGPSKRGTYVWSAIVSRPGMADAEIRSIVTVPQVARVTASVARGRLRIAGTVTANGRGVAAVRVRVEVANRRRTVFALSGRTHADGRFEFRHPLARGTFFVRTGTYPAQRDVTKTGCAGPAEAPGGCVSATRIIVGLAGTPASIRIRSARVP